MFRRNTSPPSSEFKNKPRKKPASEVCFNGLQGVISQKIELYITKDVRISNPTYPHCYQLIITVLLLGKGLLVLGLELENLFRAYTGLASVRDVL
jgi:hypothetical protein